MLIVDWFHWRVLGDLSLDPAAWPDPAAMNRELHELGYKVMIRCWPRFMRESRHYAWLEQQGWLMTTRAVEVVYGTPKDQRGALIDTTHPAAGRWFGEQIQHSYGAQGFDAWWLDENEPDIDPHPYRLHADTGVEVANLYPLTHCAAVYEVIGAAGRIAA